MDTRWRDVGNLLVVRLDNLGDVLLTTPAIHAIKKTLPGAKITLLASQVGAQVRNHDPDIDDVIVYEAPWMDAKGVLNHDSKREMAMIRLLKKRRFDGAIIFTSYHQSSLPAAYLCYLADIPLRHGASIDGPGILLTTRHRHPPQIMHEVERGLDLVAGVGFMPGEKDLVLRTNPEDEDRAARLLDEIGVTGNRQLVVIHPGCSFQARTYPWGHYAHVANLLAESIGCQVLFTGAAEEVELVRKIQSWIKWDTLSVAGRTDLGTLAAIIARANLVITNNTGPMHVAAAMKTPVIALFALTNPPEQWGPWMVPHRILSKPTPCAYCYSRICPVGHECLTLVSPEEVVDSAEALLRENATVTVGTGCR